MIRKITEGEKEIMISPQGGYGKLLAKESGVLVVPDNQDFYGIFLTDAMLRTLGYQPIPKDVEQNPGIGDADELVGVAEETIDKPSE